MSNQLARQETSVPVFNFFDPVQFETMQRVSLTFANSELVPDMYKISDKNPKEKAIANCMIAIEISQRIGASPLMVMQNMTPIYGKPSWSSKFLIATVNTCGRFEPLKFEFKNLGKLGKVEYTEYDKVWDQSMYKGKGGYKITSRKATFDGTNIDNIQCIAYTTAKGSTEKLESSPVSIKTAVDEGWYTRNGSKWTTLTKQMLMYRAASFWTSTYAPELSMGMRTVEENEDIREVEDIPYEEVKDKVEKEIKSEANKETISFDAEKVDTETGEVAQENKEIEPPEQPKGTGRIPSF